MSDRLRKQMDFIREIDREKQIFRQTYLADGSRRENDAEHAWHMAVMAFLLSEYANEPVDVSRLVLMVLIHDLVEIDAGDTYAYDQAGHTDKRARESAAADRLFSILPEDQGTMLRGLWEEFESGLTPEARFASALDRCQPVLLNDASGGISWKEHGIALSQVLARNRHTPEGSEALWAYTRGLLEKNAACGNLIPDVQEQRGR